MDTANATHALCHSLLRGFHQAREPMERVSEWGISVLLSAIADAEGSEYAYIGNVPGHPAENTRCPKWRRLLVERAGFTIRQNHIRKGKCEYCQRVIPGVWS